MDELSIPIKACRKVHRELVCCPALGPLVAYASGLGAVLFDMDGWGILALANFTLLVAWLRDGRRWWRCWSLFLLGVAVGWRAMDDSSGYYGTYMKYLHRDAQRVVCEGRVAGYPLNGELLDFKLARIHAGTGWHSCCGMVKLRLQEEERAGYGDSFRVVGCLMRPDLGEWTCEYRRHLQTQGILHELTAEQVELLEVASGWRRVWRAFLGWRESLSGLLVDGFQSDELKGMYLAMFMGRRDLFPVMAREAFVRSATIHVFAISGLHVNCLMVVICCLFRLLGGNRRLACLLALPVVLVYILLTGGGPSSMRAFLMLCGMGMALVMYRRGNTRHVLCLAALVLLLTQPMYLMNIGFQFSFLMVAILVYGQGMEKRVEAVLTERRLWRLRNSKRQALYHIMCSIMGMVLSCLLAWSGSLAMILYVNRMIPLGALGGNLVVQPVASLLVGGGVPKIILSCLCPSAGRMLGCLLELLMAVALQAAGCGGDGAWCWEMRQMPGCWAWLYVAVFMLLLVGYRWRWMVQVGLGILISLVVMECGQEQNVVPYVKVCRDSSGNQPAVLLLLPRSREVEILYPGCENTARKAVAVLQRMGVGKIRRMYSYGGKKEKRGVSYWLQHFKVEEWYTWRTLNIEQEVNDCLGEGIHIGYGESRGTGICYCAGNRKVRYAPCLDGWNVHVFDRANGVVIRVDLLEDGLVVASWLGKEGAGVAMFRIQKTML